MSRKKLLTNKKICDRIKDLRLSLNLTGLEFSNNIGISQGYLSDIENSKASPSKTLLLAISYAYNINIDWLLTGENEPDIIRKQSTSTTETTTSSRTPLNGGVSSEYIPEDSIYKDRIQGGSDQGFKVSEVLTMAARVLESGTSYALALLTNIQHFDRAIQAEARISDLENKNKDQADRIGKLENECEDLRKRLAALEEKYKLIAPQDEPDEAAA